MGENTDRLEWRERIGFGAGDFAQNLVYPAVSLYLLFFYTDVFGLAPAVAATLFLVVQVVDALLTPFVGAFIDRYNPSGWWSRGPRDPTGGKYRSYLVLAGIPFAALSVLCFWDPFGGGASAWKTAYACVTYVGFTLFFAFVNVAYGALSASLTRDMDEITVLTSVRIFLANAGCFVAAAGVPLLIGVFARGGGTVGFRALPWRMAVFMGFGILPSFIFMPLVPIFRRHLGKKGIFYVFAAIAIGGMIALYALSRFGRIEDHIGWVAAAQFVKATGIIVATGYVWALVPEVIAYGESRTGKRLSGIVNAIVCVFFKAGMAIGRVVPGVVLALTGYQAASGGARSCVSVDALPADPHAWLWTLGILALIAIVCLVFSFSQTMERVVMDAADAAQVKTGDLWREFRRNAPLRILAFFFVTTFAMMSTGNAAGAYFMNGLEMQTPLAQEGIRWLVCVIPALLFVVSAAILVRYPLTDETLDRFNRET